MPMNVVSRTTLESFWNKHSTAEGPLTKWYTAACRAKWTCFADVRQTFGSADFVHKLVVFDVGNGLRVIADVYYPARRVYIKHVYTHTEYDRWTKRQQGKP